jgi:hypothetical protein
MQKKNRLKSVTKTKDQHLYVFNVPLNPFLF